MFEYWQCRCIFFLAQQSVVKTKRQQRKSENFHVRKRWEDGIHHINIWSLLHYRTIKIDEIPIFCCSFSLKCSHYRSINVSYNNNWRTASTVHEKTTTTSIETPFYFSFNFCFEQLNFVGRVNESLRDKWQFTSIEHSEYAKIACIELLNRMAENRWEWKPLTVKCLCSLPIYWLFVYYLFRGYIDIRRAI